MADPMKRNVLVSDCGRYRYLLSRQWDRGDRQALFIMLNPSTADAEIDDATIRSCIRLCKAWSFGGFEVVNLFGWRATDPKELLTASEDPVGSSNDRIAKMAINRCDVVICAWGQNKVMGSFRPKQMRDLVLSQRSHVAFCLGITKGGHPKHPLYVKTETLLQIYCGGLSGAKVLDGNDLKG